MNSVALSSDGKTLASSFTNHAIQLWDTATGAHHKQPLRGHDAYVSVVIFSPDSKTLASASDDRTIRLWEAATSTQQHMLKGHGEYTRAAVFSKNGKMLVSMSADFTIQLWDVATGQHCETRRVIRPFQNSQLVLYRVDTTFCWREFAAKSMPHRFWRNNRKSLDSSNFRTAGTLMAHTKTESHEKLGAVVHFAVESRWIRCGAALSTWQEKVLLFDPFRPFLFLRPLSLVYHRR